MQESTAERADTEEPSRETSLGDGWGELLQERPDAEVGQSKKGSVKLICLICKRTTKEKAGVSTIAWELVWSVALCACKISNGSSISFYAFDV